MRVIYIAGMSHSGSTVLSLMLNAHPEIISVGELIDIKRRIKIRSSGEETGSPCACGAASLSKCDFWARVDQRTMEMTGQGLGDLDILNDRPLREDPSNAVVFRAISEASGKTVVVDSSKRPGRLSYLLKQKGLQVFPIHLIRNPNGQVFSLRKKNGGFLRHIYRYVRVHEQIRRTLKSVPHAVVHYEDLVLDPQAILSSVLEPIGLSFDSKQLEWRGQRQHALGGNKLRWQPNNLSLDERWKQSLTPLQQLLVGVGTAFSRRRFLNSPCGAAGDRLDRLAAHGPYPPQGD